jgi:lipoprotein-releasing system permease protein
MNRESQFGLPYTLAWQYLKSKRKGNSIAFMTRLCFAGIFVGTTALMLTLIIMSGFERVVSKKMQSINSDAIAYSLDGPLDYEEMKSIKNLSSVKAVSGSSTRQIILSNQDKRSIIMLKGVDPEAEGLTSSIFEKIKTNKSHSELLSEKKIILGHKVAKSLEFKIDEKITLLVPEPKRKNKIALEEHDVTISALFDIGLEEYDNNMAYCSLETMYQMFEDEEGVDQLAISLKENSNIATLRSELAGLEIRSWQELYPALVSSLKLEKYVMFCLLALITLVASMNMVSLLFMQVQSKRGDIAILKVMGMPASDIKKIFVSIGLFISIVASTLGLLFSFVIGLFLQAYPIIKLPDVYYVSHLPAHMNIWQFVFVFCITLLISLVATLTPSSLAQRVSITSVLRQE